ncbi:MAG: 23S rRNA (pseudouridine(1915)-N(3))-methyltransferase RlmH [Candidatus Eremiobacteraeota bacterium]|nr:23S rRNA (pseudouridine(1915)-N(3))-methyltransferase RlmH [Candidatus Eremiobacteraeota bacterium]
MQIRIIAVDKIRQGYAAAACAELRKRLAPYYAYEEIEVKAAHGGDPAAATAEESERVRRLLRPDDRVWLLERSGTQLSSVGLSKRLLTAAESPSPRLTMIIAGTYGASAVLRERAEFLWSLSALTLLHEWARMLVLEQLYRAAKIARNEPYHH